MNLASPTRFLSLSQSLLPWLTGLTVVLFAIGLPWALLISPPDYQQGESVRIMYIHVPAAWLAMGGYALVAVASGCFLIWRHPLADVAAAAAAPLGAAFTLMTLVTGSLWGKPTWGTWWVWDARLTSVLVLFFIYLGYIALRDALPVGERRSKLCAILALVGAANLPIIKFSVEWWNTLHQPASVFRLDGPTIDAQMLWPLLVMALAFTSLFAVLSLLRMRTALMRQKLLRMQLE